MEFSKSHLIFSWIVTLILTGVSVTVSLLGLPTDVLIVVTPLSWAETGASTVYYYWKARNENRAKYAQRFLRDFADDHGAEIALRVAEIVLKE